MQRQLATGSELKESTFQLIAITYVYLSVTGSKSRDTGKPSDGSTFARLAALSQMCIRIK